MKAEPEEEHLAPAQAALAKHRQRFAQIYGICVFLLLYKITVASDKGQLTTTELGIICLVYGGMILLVIGFDLLLRLNIKVKYK